MDKVSINTRSKIMSRVRSTGNRSTEMRLRAFLVREGLRGWRVQPREIFGKPDFVFDDEKVAVFVDGAFWHGAPGFSRFPKSRLEYWKPKIQGNIRRDKKITSHLRRNGWAVLRFWDYELKDQPGNIIHIIRTKIRQRRNLRK